MKFMQNMRLIRPTFYILLLITMFSCGNKSKKNQVLSEIEEFGIDSIVDKHTDAMTPPEESEYVMGWMQQEDELEYKIVNYIIKAYYEESAPSSIIPVIQPMLDEFSTKYFRTKVASDEDLQKVLNVIISDSHKNISNEDDSRASKIFAKAALYYSSCYNRYRVDTIIRKYPELYHVADKVEEAYNKWLERENTMIDVTFVGKEVSSIKFAQNKKDALERRFQNMNLIPTLNNVLNEKSDIIGEDTKIKEEDFDKAYRKIMFKIKDGIKESSSNYSTDEMRTSVEKSRRAWNEYMAIMPEFLENMPKSCKEQMEKAINKSCRLHLIDLTNMYLHYWSEKGAQMELKDDASYEIITSANIEPNKLCKTME